MLKTEIVLKFGLEICSGLRIGGTDPDREEVLQVETTSGSYPLIPRSSLKGVLRSEFERLEKLALKPVECEFKHGRNKKLLWSEILFGFAKKEDEDTYFSLKGAVQVSDVLLEDTAVRTRNHVRIDRKRQTHAPGGLFSQQVVESEDSKGIVEVRIANIDQKEPLKVLFFILDEISTGHIGIGARSSAGLGAVRGTNRIAIIAKEDAQLLGIVEPSRVRIGSFGDLMNHI